jgi:hypothetical protein
LIASSMLSCCALTTGSSILVHPEVRLFARARLT